MGEYMLLRVREANDLLQRAGPYLLLEMLLPGGTLFALLLYLLRRVQAGADGTAQGIGPRVVLDRLAPMTEAQWLARARSEMRPPMPWFNLRDMTDDDLRAIHAYVRSLGAAGQPAPAYAAPGQKVDTPYIVFEPQNVPARHARKD